MAQPARLIVGLGNPGSDYAMTRHNIGFMAMDVLAPSSSWQKKFNGLYQNAVFGGLACLLLKPSTFMNLSGESVGEASRFFKIAPENVIVFHDDIDLPAGTVRVKQGGGNAGHNGLKSLDAHIGVNYWRVRLGVGHPTDRSEVVNYVLGTFSKADRLWLEALLGEIGPALPQLLEGKPATFASQLARAVTKACPQPKETPLRA